MPVETPRKLHWAERANRPSKLIECRRGTVVSTTVTTVLFPPPATPPAAPRIPARNATPLRAPDPGRTRAQAGRTAPLDDYLPVNDPMPVAEGAGIVALSDDEVVLPTGLRLALRRAPGLGRPALLVHALASTARAWDGVARRLAAGGHEVVTMDLRGHGRSAAPTSGYNTATAADDLAELICALGLVGERAPVVAGQSWGGDVALELAARHRGLAGLALVDGGWTRDHWRHPERSWAALGAPGLDPVPAAEFERRLRRDLSGWPEEAVEGTLANFRIGPDGCYAARLTRQHHRAIVSSLRRSDPRALYPRVDIPVLLLAAVPRAGAEPGPGQIPGTRAGAREALAALPDAEVRWYVGAHHDLHAQRPEAVAADLLALLRRVSTSPGPGPGTRPDAGSAPPG